MIAIIIGVVCFILGNFSGMFLTSLMVVASRDKREDE